ncbi:type II secretion system F family protein [Natronosalvus rutilus]|uniref:Type II secretion system F family protein n=1 Tax=Natronosalvus rutilus TaxID=2953753 RepID=A0A9E7NAW6_9EURY|nr:type II secretion system F family protein [Natronosalvus rutilus]UTF54061.1 type II secretion system F family protein [Natronosalvus rutilus]
MSLQSSDGPGGIASSSDLLGEMFYPLYDWLFSEDSQFVSDLETKLAQARMTDTVEMYLSRSLGIGFIAGLVLWLMGLMLGYGLFATGVIQVDTIIGFPVSSETVLSIIETLRIPALIVTTGLFFGSLGFAFGFGTLVAIPYSRASTRKREINMLLTDAVSYMYALSVGGLNQLEILEAMAEADDTYGEVSKEFQSIVQETEYFDVDYRTAIRKQAIETPSDDLSQFLTDMLSIVNSGGDMESFLEDKKEKHMRTAKQEQELTLETLELFGEMYMTLSLFPLLLIIILVIMQMVPDAAVNPNLLFMSVYGLIPLTGVAFIVLVSTVKHDEPGDGYLGTSSGDSRIKHEQDRGLLNLGLVEQYTGAHRVFDRIKNREGTHETVKVLQAPHLFFRDNPLFTLALTVPAALVVVTTAMVNGSAPTSWEGMKARPVWGTFIYLYAPLYITMVPLSVFREWNVISRNAVVKTLSEDLRKLASANDTGLTLLESLKSVSETTSGRLARELELMHTKVNYGMSLSEALVEFNNKYHIPRLARTVKLITKSQEASNQISAVLRTAARSSENHDDIERERKSRTRMQVVIIIMTFMTLLAVIAILQTQFIGTMAGLETGGSDVDAGANSQLADANFSENVDIDQLSLLFFHAVTLQAVLSGFISGYIRDADLLSGLKYVIILSTIALVAWALVA